MTTEAFSTHAVDHVVRGIHTECAFRSGFQRMRIRLRILIQTLIRLRVHTTKELPTRMHSVTPLRAWQSRDH